MEEVGAQVAHPLFVHQSLPGRFCELPPMVKKRDLAWQTHGFHQLQQQQQHQRFQNPIGNWDSRVWNWDSARFVAKPLESGDVLRLGSMPAVLEPGQKQKGGEEVLKNQIVESSLVEDGENLNLKLGGSSVNVEEPVARPNKRVRSGSPGSGNYPMCQVDDCSADLTNAKDYHRRHKVCEVHSKTTKALVGKKMQRFCQQCSRFHPLSEFDEGKRSCRRRLAGHNRRRRKTQQEDTSSQLQAVNVENAGNGNLDIVNLLGILARFQCNNADKTNNNGASLPARDWLVQILGKINPPPVAANSTTSVPAPRGFDLNVSQEVPPEHPPNKVNGNLSAPSTTDLLAILSAAVGAPSPDALANLSRSSHSSNDDKGKLNCLDLVSASNLLKKPPVSGFQSVGGERSCTSFQSPTEVSDCHVQDARPGLPLQLFTSSLEEVCPSKLGSARKYVSSDSSNPMEERSPSCSPPLAQKLFPLQTTSEITKHESLSISGGGEDNGTAEASTTHCWGAPLELFKGSNGRAENNFVQSLPYQAGYTSSGSDHSPSTSNSDVVDRTGRIIFKLFDKDPSNFPPSLRTKILDWLARSPSEMESYIRPGCVVLSIYLSMPSAAWERLQEDLLQHMNLLVQDSDTDFWRSGRFLVQTDRQLASHKDGKIRLCKSWRTWSSPEVVSVSPLAIVGGRKASLVLRGRNLNVPGTKIHCTYMGGYISKEVQGSVGTVYDEASLESFSFPGVAPNALGRCFIEVENGFKGNSFPVIIADDAICQELRHLEPELEEDSGMSDLSSEDKTQDFGRPQSREDKMNFLYELGWLFQRKSNPSSLDNLDFSPSRSNMLLTFSVERDWCASVKTVLDILVERNLINGGLSRDFLVTFSEINLLNRAVKRKCTSMVNMLINYSISSSSDGSKNYLFPPNQAGPGLLTPLHLAACTHNSDAIVDALTNDPQQIGLRSWTSLKDENGKSPYAYASMRNNHSYNRLVAQKIHDREHGQLSITVGDGTSLDQSWIIAEQAAKPSNNLLHLEGQRSCARCAAVATRCRNKQMAGAQGLLHRPYIRSMLAIAAVCVCVCLFLRGAPDIGSVAPFKWENLHYGTS